MEELISILQDIKDDVDFENCTTLIDASEIVPKNFNSAAALYAMVQRLQED